MGIPSYYKKLIDIVPGLVSRSKKDIQWLFMDFNCLIYHCINEDYKEDLKEEWEDKFLDSIVKYCLNVIKEVNPLTGVFIAIDGVVPMAKMRQQRLRRFKSVWTTTESTTESTAESSAKWDKNAITPGTLFMGKLKQRLQSLNYILSSSDEPGEGEHKIIAEWRKGTYKGNYAVYGLDADLIVLSMLGHECYNLNSIWLFREDINDENDIFNWFSINLLKDWLCSRFERKREFILNYCFALSILGNDFLPSSLGLKMREDGHSKLLDIIECLTFKKICLIDPVSLVVVTENVMILFKTLSADEPARISKYIYKKQMLANNIETELKLGEHNWPLAHIEESVLLDRKQLCIGWQEKYAQFLSGSKEEICREYLLGIQWIWSYYTGNDVCFNWYYPHNLPPLWEWICTYLSTHPIPTLEIHIRGSDIKPVEQLALVLPLESWSLLPLSLRCLPFFAPQYYPHTFSFESIGKRYFWECEPLIPIPSILEIKHILTTISSK